VKLLNTSVEDLALILEYSSHPIRVPYVRSVSCQAITTYNEENRLSNAAAAPLLFGADELRLLLTSFSDANAHRRSKVARRLTL